MSLSSFLSGKWRVLHLNNVNFLSLFFGRSLSLNGKQSLCIQHSDELKVRPDIYFSIVYVCVFVC